MNSDKYLIEILAELKKLNANIQQLLNGKPSTGPKATARKSDWLSDADFTGSHEPLIDALDKVHGRGELSGWPAKFADDVLARGYDKLTQKQFDAACKIVAECGYKSLAELQEESIPEDEIPF